MSKASAALAGMAGLRADGPDEMGRELFAGPGAVAATLARLAPELPRLRADLAAARRVVLVGTGASLAMVRAVAPLWRGSGDGRPVVRESSAVVFGAADGETFRAGDVAVVVSKSGGSPETVAAARAVLEAGARVIAVTADREAALAGVAGDVVWTPIGDEAGAATKSELSALAALLALAGLLDPAAAEDVAGRLAAIAADWTWAPERGSVLAAADHLWIVGFGPAEGIAQAAALMWHEKVHRPAVATTPSEFRHGPIESASDRDAVILVERLEAGASESAYLELLSSEAARLGTVLIRVAPPAASDSERILAALLRLQQLARATAHAAGTYRDGFRVLREIVKAAEL